MQAEQLTPSPPLPRKRGGSRPSTPRVHQSPSTQCNAPNETDRVLRPLPSRPPRPRRIRVRARRRARPGRSEAAAAVGAHGAAHRAPVRAEDNRRRQHAALGGADPARADLREARTIPGDAAGRGRHRAGARSRIAAGQDGAVPAGASRDDDRGSARRAAGEAVHLVRRGGRGGLDRAGASRHRGGAGRAEAGGGESLAARHRAALRGRSRRHHVRGPQCRALLGRGEASASH